MFRSKPALVILASAFSFLYKFLLLSVGITAVFYIIKIAANEAIVAIISSILAILFYRLDRGIIKRKNWARPYLTAIFGLLFLAGGLNLLEIMVRAVN